jgi:hypothetical protein
MAKPYVPDYPQNTKKLRGIPLHEIPENIFSEPPNTENVKLQCGCGCVYPPPWREKLPLEWAPAADATGKIFVLSGLPIACPKCGTRNTLTFPSTPARGHCHLYGDEASDEARQGLFYVYAFVGINPGTTIIKDSLSALKTKIRPAHDPSSWPLHVWEIRDSRWRVQHHIKLNIHEIDAAFLDFAQSLAAQPDSRFISVTVMPPITMDGKKKKEVIDYVRYTALTVGIMTTTEFVTRQGLSVEYTIEAQTLAHRDHQIDYFVERIGRGLNHNLVFHWMRNGKYVGLPTTAPKGSTIELEVADFVAFWTRRYLSRFDRGLQSEIPPESFGKTYWGCLVNRRFGTHYSVGFPWDFFNQERARGIGGSGGR